MSFYGRVWGGIKMIKRIVSKLENNKTMLKVLGINSSCCNRHILKSQWLNPERLIAHPHHRLVLVSGSPPSGDSGVQAASILQLHHLPGGESQSVEKASDCLGLKRLYHFHLHFHWPECSHMVPAELQRRLGNAISCV